MYFVDMFVSMFVSKKKTYKSFHFASFFRPAPTVSIKIVDTSTDGTTSTGGNVNLAMEPDSRDKATYEVNMGEAIYGVNGDENADNVYHVYGDEAAD